LHVHRGRWLPARSAQRIADKLWTPKATVSFIGLLGGSTWTQDLKCRFPGGKSTRASRRLAADGLTERLLLRLIDERSASVAQLPTSFDRYAPNPWAMESDLEACETDLGQFVTHERLERQISWYSMHRGVA